MRKHYIGRIILAALACAVLSASAFAANEWPGFRQNLQRTGHASDNTLLGYNLGPIWHFHADTKIQDASSATFHPSGGWQLGTACLDRYGEQYRYRNTVTGAGDGYALWTFDFTDTGAHPDQKMDGWAARYYIYVWIPSPNFAAEGTLRHSTDARYTVKITDAGGDVSTYTYTIDQSYGGAWVGLNSLPLVIRKGDVLTISLSNFSSVGLSDGIVIADAVKLERASMVIGSPSALGPTAPTTGENKTLLAPVTESVAPAHKDESDIQQTKGVLYSIGVETSSGVANTGPVWKAGTRYLSGQYVRPSTPNGHTYRCSKAGVTGAAEPAWPIIPKGTVVDGGVTWAEFADDRGFAKWQFPANPGNWIEGAISSTPAIITSAGLPGILNGTEVAVFAAGDGQVYAVKTSDGSLIWQGPGWIDDSPVMSGAWAAGGHIGFQGSGYQHIAAAKPATATATWNFNVNTNKRRAYAVYAWIPKSTKAEPYISDAYYEISVNGGNAYRAVIDQSVGGRWVRLGNFARTLDTGAHNIQVKLDNSTATPAGAGSYYVAADAVKLVPEDLGVFEFSSTAVTPDGKVYVGSTSGRVFCLQVSGDASYQEPVWTYPDPASHTPPLGVIYASPALSKDNSTLYVGSAAGHVYAIDTTLGTLKWDYWGEVTDSDPSKWITLGRISSTTAVGDYIYVATGGAQDFPPPGKELDGNVIALQDTGASASLIWRYPQAGSDTGWAANPDNDDSAGAFMYSSPLLMTVGADTAPSLFVGSTDGYFYGIHAQTGKGYKSGPDASTTGRRWIGSIYADQNLWTLRYPDLGNTIYSSPAGTKAGTMDMAYVGCESSNIYGIDLATGSNIWHFNVFDSVTSSPAIYDGRLYVGDMKGYAWGFSSRSDGEGGDSGSEKWNENISRKPPTGGSRTPAPVNAPRRAVPEVDIFTETAFNSIITDINNSKLTGVAMNPDLHSRAISRTTDDPIKYEWGDKLYFIVWKLLNPNYDNNTGIETPARGAAGFREVSASNVTLTFKSRAKGDVADTSETQTLVGKDNKKGYFIGWNDPWKANTAYRLGDYITPTTKKPTETGRRYRCKTGGTSGASEPGWATAGDPTAIADGAGTLVWEDAGTDAIPIYYAIYEYSLENPTRSRPQVPGSRISVTAREVPAASSGDSSASTVCPRNPNAGRDKYTPKYIGINNPLGLIITDEDTVGDGKVNNVTIGLYNANTTDVDAPYADVNGNWDRLPYLRLGQTSHGTTSATRKVTICDRSRLGRNFLTLQRMRAERHDLVWIGGPGNIAKTKNSMVTTLLPWEISPPPAYQNLPNTSPDYPDIQSSKLGCNMEGSGIDPAQWPVTLMPGGNFNADNTVNWTVGQNGMRCAVSIPRFQPANMDDADSRYSGYGGRIFVYIDTNGNGRLERAGTLGVGSIIRRSIAGARAETYREFIAQVHVPADRRVQIEEKVIDIGQVPQGFGITGIMGTAPNSYYVPFWSNLTDCVHNQWDPSAGKWGFGEWFKPFTAYNLGNTNLTNIFVGWMNNNTRVPGGSSFFSDTVQDPTFATNSSGTWNAPAYNLGNWIDGSYLTSSLDDKYLTDSVYAPVPGLSTRTFHKARVGETAPVLKLADAPTRLYDTYGLTESNGRYPYLPSVSVAVPPGTPVGTYYGSFYLSDAEAPDPAWRSNSVTAVVTVTEARLTDGYTAGSMYHLDSTNSEAGDMTPAAYRDRTNNNIYMFWSSNRGGSGSPGSALDSWFLRQAKLPWDGRVYGTSVTPGWWSVDSVAHPTAPVAIFTEDGVGTSGQLVESGMRFGSPSVAERPAGDEAWLFFSAQAYKDKGNILQEGNQSRALDSRIYCTEITGGKFGNKPVTLVTEDSSMPKFGVNGLATNSALWCFWYGGTNNKWRIYYTMKPDGSDWQTEVQLPIPKGLTSVAQPCAMFRPALGNASNLIEVVYAGYSSYHKNTDIYLSLYAWDATKKRLVLQGLTEQNEALTRSATEPVWYARDVDWLADDFKIQVVSGATTHDLTTGKAYTVDRTTGARVYTYAGDDDAELRTLFRAIVVDPAAGTVR
ncbi:MAG: PQQ-binding-like beta-propeller repeat protein, partial [Armatimonadota bacterium]